MSKIKAVEDMVNKAYLAKDPNRADWADWLYKNHVLVVADYAEELAKRLNASVEDSRAIALLHDIADAVMQRENPEHESESLKIAEEYLRESGFTEDRIRVLVDDALTFHSCRNGNKPQSLEGKVLATADALAHLNTDFYEFAKAESKNMPAGWFKDWIAEKLPRDFSEKILFEEVKHENKDRYDELLKKYTKTS